MVKATFSRHVCLINAPIIAGCQKHQKYGCHTAATNIYLAKDGTGIRVPNVRIVTVTAFPRFVHLAKLCYCPNTHTHTHTHTHTQVTFLIATETDSWERGDFLLYQETNRENLRCFVSVTSVDSRWVTDKWPVLVQVRCFDDVTLPGNDKCLSNILVVGTRFTVCCAVAQTVRRSFHRVDGQV
jgi:hypothetical protein